MHTMVKAVQGLEGELALTLMYFNLTNLISAPSADLLARYSSSSCYKRPRLHHPTSILLPLRTYDDTSQRFLHLINTWFRENTFFFVWGELTDEDEKRQKDVHFPGLRHKKNVLDQTHQENLVFESILSYLALFSDKSERHRQRINSLQRITMLL